jgi:hypothetical protein
MIAPDRQSLPRVASHREERRTKRAIEKGEGSWIAYQGCNHDGYEYEEIGQWSIQAF